MPRDLTPVMEDYLKAIFQLGRTGRRVTTRDLARHFGVKPATVTQTLQRLAALRLVEYEPYRGVTLTEAGRRIALEVIRHHRLIEQYLHQVLGIPWHRVHQEAERWEHVISEEVEERMAEVLGHPRQDPHGAPIPGPDLSWQEEPLEPLSDLAPGDRARVAQVADEDPELLLYLEARGLLPRAEVQVVAREPVSEDLWVVVQGHRHRVAHRAACQVWVQRLASGPAEPVDPDLGTP